MILDLMCYVFGGGKFIKLFFHAKTHKAIEMTQCIPLRLCASLAALRENKFMDRCII